MKTYKETFLVRTQNDKTKIFQQHIIQTKQQHDNTSKQV